MAGAARVRTPEYIRLDGDRAPTPEDATRGSEAEIRGCGCNARLLFQRAHVQGEGDAV